MIAASTITEALDLNFVRAQFPILKRKVKGKPLVYFDNAATTQKPAPMIGALVEYYSNYNANIHRGIHSLAEEATAAFEETRDSLRAFLNAAAREEIIFTRGATEGINLVTNTWGRKNIREGDEIIVSHLEHHSNIVPWQLLCEEKGAILKVIPIDQDGNLDLEAFETLLSPRTKFVSIVHVSNSLGIVNPVKQIIARAHAFGALTLIDGAQSSVHLDIDVQDMNCDFFVMSAHKLYGPTGFGALYGKKSILEAMPVFHGGGEMIKEVRWSGTTYNDLPYKFEAGTPNIADAVAFKASLDFVSSIGKEKIRIHEKELVRYASEQLNLIEGLRIIGNSEDKISVVSFVLDKIHPQDIGILLDNAGVAVRTGNHCTQPLMDFLCIPGTIRASFAMYNTKEEIDIMVAGLQKAVKLLR